MSKKIFAYSLIKVIVLIFLHEPLRKYNYQMILGLTVREIT